MKIEVGKYYLRRDGVMVGPIEESPDYPSYPFFYVKDLSCYTVTATGKYSNSSLDDSEFDLIQLAVGGTTSSNPKAAQGAAKVQLHLVPPASLIYQALAMEDGAAKYGPYNWRKNSVNVTTYISAAIRHLQSYLDGEESAQDSKKPHLGHALASIGIIVDAKENDVLIDDRPPVGCAANLIERLKNEKKHE